MAKRKVRASQGGRRPGAGRPREIDDGERINVRVPRAVIERYDAEAERAGTVRSALMREAIVRGAGLLP